MAFKVSCLIYELYSCITQILIICIFKNIANNYVHYHSIELAIVILTLFGENFMPLQQIIPLYKI